MTVAPTLAAAAAAPAGAGPTGAAPGQPALSVTPERPTTNDEIMLSLDVSRVALIGLPRFSWDLDGDGSCEYDTPGDAVAVALTLGRRTIGGCVTHGGGTVKAQRQIMVWPATGAPSFTVRPARRTTRAAFARSGTVLRVTWNQPMRATFAGAYNRTSTAPGDARALRVSTTQTSRTTQVVRIGAPRASVRATRIAVTANTSADPIFGPLEPELTPADRVSGVVLLPKR